MVTDHVTLHKYWDYMKVVIWSQLEFTFLNTKKKKGV